MVDAISSLKGSDLRQKFRTQKKEMLVQKQELKVAKKDYKASRKAFRHTRRESRRRGRPSGFGIISMGGIGAVIGALVHRSKDSKISTNDKEFVKETANKVKSFGKKGLAKAAGKGAAIGLAAYGVLKGVQAMIARSESY